MTTAHKPTFNAAMGSAEQGGSMRGVVSRQTSAKDQSAHTKLHYRQEGQNGPTELKNRDFKAELEARERKAKRALEDADESRDSKRQKLEAAPAEVPVEQIEFNVLDRDDESSDASSSEDSDDSGDETAELMRELERIKKERESEQQRVEAEREAAALESKAQSVLTGNPLLNTADDDADFVVKKKWYEDTVFRNQTRSAPKAKKARYINDTIRNDFHRKFLNKYIK
eukprot:TRINITY_DN2836_c0_g1_i1.p1 TRINITY_DN2836_c0_g1~~TRINITY_DN2836_c0_g1_i1.p1  ORF type:complete len:227 (+),score=78.70 TRINITY_DN2836_c0_g1_i1:57-737(+)